MIHQISIPIARALSPEQAFLEQSKYPDSDAPNHPNRRMETFNEEMMAEFSQYLDDGYTVIDSFDSQGGVILYRQYMLFKADKPTGAAAIAGNVGILQLAHAITKKQTWSKTANQYFEYWRLELANGRFCNVFNHPDMSRNTYKLVQDAGWTDLWELFNLDETYVLDTPIAVVVSEDNEWLKLEQITAFMEYTNYAPFTYIAESENEAQTDETENE